MKGVWVLVASHSDLSSPATWVARCPVGANCRVPSHCPYCVEGSEYRPMDRAIRFPAAAARQAERKAARQAAKTSDASRRGKRSARKGRRVEQEAARYFGGKRVPLSGALDGLANDVVLPNGWRVEVKARASGLSWLYADLARYDWVAVRDPADRWLVAVTGERFLAGFSAEARAAIPTAPWQFGVVATAEIRGCLKARAKVDTLWQWLAAEHADALLFKADRRGWLVICDPEHWRAWLANSRGPTAEGDGHEQADGI